MKKLLISLSLTIISITVFAQKNQDRDLHNFNFDNENKRIYWQKVYEKCSYDDIKRLVTDMGCTINHDDSARISGSTPMNNLRMPKGAKKYNEDYYGGDGGLSRPIYFEPCTIYFSIDIKSDRCRVTVTNMIWTSKTTFLVFGVMMNVGNMDINKILVRKNGKLRSGAGCKDDFSFLNECLDIVFNIKKNSINTDNDNW